MKLKYNIFALVLLAATAVSCTDGFETTNTDPNKLYGNNVELRNIFPGSVLRTMNAISDLNYYRMWYFSRQMASIAFSQPWNERGDNYYNQFYVGILRDLKTLDDKYTAEANKPNALAVVKTWEAFVYYQLTSLYGPIGMSDTGMGDDTTKRAFKYDSEEEAYTNILNMLSTAVDLFTTSASGDALTSDPVYGGDVEKWRKMANTLRLDVALNFQNISLEKAKEYAARSMEHEDWLISSLDDALAPKYGTTVDVDASRYWQRIYKEQIQTSGKYNLIPSLNEYFAVYLFTYNDPRLQCYFDPSNKDGDQSPYQMPDVLTRTHDCEVSGCSAADQAQHLQWMAEGYEVRDSIHVRYSIPYPPTPDNVGARLPFGWQAEFDPTDPTGQMRITDPLGQLLNTDKLRCFIKEKYYAKDAPLTLLRWADACFLCAEAKIKFGLGSKTAREYYEQGIRASFQENGISDALSTYMAQDGVAWGTDREGLYDTRKLMSATIHGSQGDEGKLQQIYVQRWIADFGDGLSAWRVERRTRALNLPPLFLNSQNSYEEGGDPDYGYPERMYFPDAERINNGTGYYAAVDMLQKNSPDPNPARWGDNLFTTLQFAKPVPNKESVIAGYRKMTYIPFNMDMQQKKYGADYEEFVKNAQKLTGLKDPAAALEKAYNFSIDTRYRITVYRVNK